MTVFRYRMFPRGITRCTPIKWRKTPMFPMMTTVTRFPVTPRTHWMRHILYMFPMGLYKTLKRFRFRTMQFLRFIITIPIPGVLIKIGPKFKQTKKWIKFRQTITRIITQQMTQFIRTFIFIRTVFKSQMKILHSTFMLLLPQLTF